MLEISVGEKQDVKTHRRSEISKSFRIVQAPLHLPEQAGILLLSTRPLVDSGGQFNALVDVDYIRT